MIEQYLDTLVTCELKIDFIHRNIIRVIAATKTKTRQRVQCRLYDNATKHYSTVDGTIRTIRENWNLKYR